MTPGAATNTVAIAGLGKRGMHHAEACRSVVGRGKVMLPLGPGEPELDALKNALPVPSVLAG